jgi:hypothetical protein
MAALQKIAGDDQVCQKPSTLVEQPGTFAFSVTPQKSTAP